jgi:hypothetical protein
VLDKLSKSTFPNAVVFCLFFFFTKEKVPYLQELFVKMFGTASL